MSEYGLVFAGGGAKGAYQIGVWKALNEMHIKISAVSGASIGALNGALLAQGDWEKAYQIWTSISMRDIINLPNAQGDNLFDLKNAQLIAKEMLHQKGLSTDALRALLLQYIDEQAVMASPIDLGIVTFAISDLEPTQLFKEQIQPGKLIDYLLASACFPIFRQIEIGSKRYIDGGVYNNLPISMLADRGIRDIIAVDIGGIGLVQPFKRPGYHVISIKAKDTGGLFDFTPQVLVRSIDAGYCDTLKAFGAAEGSIFTFPKGQLALLGPNAARLETLGEIYGLPRFQVMCAKCFKQKLLDQHTQYAQKFSVIKYTLSFSELAKRTRHHPEAFRALLPFFIEAVIEDLFTEKEIRMALLFLRQEYEAALALKELLS